MNDPSKRERTFAQCRDIMRAEDVPTGRLFANRNKRIMNTNQDVAVLDETEPRKGICKIWKPLPNERPLPD
jgi:hypothetical protein